MSRPSELSDEPAPGLPTRTPNKRFLQNILKDANSHNSALAAKEQRRANTFHSDHSDRDRRFREGNTRSKPRSESLDQDREPHRRRRSPKYDDRRRRRRHSPDDMPIGSTSPKRSSKSDSKRIHDRDRRRHPEDASPQGRYRETYPRRERRRRTRSRSPDPSENSRYQRSRADSPPMHGDDERPRLRCRRRRRDRSRSRSCSLVGDSSSHRSPERRTAPTKDTVPPIHPQEYGSRRRKREHKMSKSRTKAVEDSESSDPLENIIGPLPARSPSLTRYRGRGDFSNSKSAMDRHFEPGYDPVEDSGLDAESGDDWAESREAMKARQEWKRKGAERLRGVGFSETDIKKWESGKQGGDADRANVVWIKQGERREWDRGKTIEGSFVNFVAAISGDDKD